MVAVDLGAQSGRVALGSFDGALLSVDEIHRFPNIPVRVRGTLTWDVLRLYAGVLEGLSAVGSNGGHVDSVAVDSWGIDFGLLDRMGRLVQNPVHYRDVRRTRSVEYVLARVAARELYERTGIQLIPINTVFELAAMVAEDDPVLEVAERMLLIPDLIHYWLGGVCATEFTNATTTQCFDPRAGTWALDLLERIGIRTSLFQDVVSPGTVLGPLGSDVAEATRLKGVRIVATATHDTAAAVAAIPLRHREAAYISAGTWSLVGLEVEQLLINDRTFAANLTNEGGIEGRVRVLRDIPGLWLLDECRRAWALEGKPHTIEELVAMASHAPAFRSLIDPDDPLFAQPGDIPGRVRQFCAKTSQKEPERPAEVVRCIVESLALKHAQTIRLLHEATGVSPSHVHIVGGGARNALLCSWTAEAAELPVVAGPVEATEIGNLIMQAIALGELSSLDEARDVVSASFPSTVYEPHASAQWEQVRERFDQVAKAAAFHRQGSVRCTP